MADKIKGAGALLVSAAIFGMLIWWLVEVGARINTAPTVVDGSVTLDVFQRAKDILLVVLPLATTAVGFWLGNQNTEKVEEKATERIGQANEDKKAADDAAVAERHAHEEATRQLLERTVAVREVMGELRLAEQRLDLVLRTYESTDRRNALPEQAAAELLAVVRAVDLEANPRRRRPAEESEPFVEQPSGLGVREEED